MKTHEAFALAGFDEKKILQRPFFKNLNLPATDDAEILQTFDVSSLTSAVEMEKKLDDLRKLDLAVKKFRQLIKNHRRRLRSMFAELDRRSDETKQTKLDRLAALLMKYNWYCESAELFNLKFGSLFVEGGKSRDKQYRKEFGQRLKVARQAAGLTQMDIALELGISPNGYGAWEQCRTEPPIAMIIHICKKLKISADKLLGLRD